MKNLNFDYYYGGEAEQYTFYRLPKALFTDVRYKGISDGAKILYGLMLDRMALSIKNGWMDERNRVYIYFTLEDVQEYMNCQRDKGMKLLAELDSVKGVGLVERVKQGLGKPAITYVKKFIGTLDLQKSAKPTLIRLIEAKTVGALATTAHLYTLRVCAPCRGPFAPIGTKGNGYGSEWLSE